MNDDSRHAVGDLRRNDFDALRLLAAATVLGGHAWPLTGRGGSPELAGVPLFDFAVYVFFAISGYLVATSWRRGPHPGPFLARRALRIFPALVVVVLVATFVIGPLTSSLGPAGYFADPGSWGYLQSLTLMPAYRLPGVFEQNPLHIVNGSLWTLGPEFLCYLGVLAVGLAVARLPGRTGSRIRLAVHLVLAAGLAVAGLLPVELGGARPVLLAMAFFFVSAVIAEAMGDRRRLPLWPVPVLLVAWVGIGCLVPGSIVPLAWIALPYSVIAIGLSSTPVLRRAARAGDASYGVYLWAFPVQQLLVLAWPDLPLLPDILLVATLAYGLGLLSWHTVEKRAIALAHRVRAGRTPAIRAEWLPNDPGSANRHESSRPRAP